MRFRPGHSFLRGHNTGSSEDVGHHRRVLSEEDCDDPTGFAILSIPAHFTLDVWRSKNDRVNLSQARHDLGLQRCVINSNTREHSISGDPSFPPCSAGKPSGSGHTPIASHPIKCSPTQMCVILDGAGTLYDPNRRHRTCASLRLFANQPPLVRWRLSESTEYKLSRLCLQDCAGGETSGVEV